MSRLITFSALVVTCLLISSVANAAQPRGVLSRLAGRLQGAGGEVSATQVAKDLLHQVKDKLTGVEVHGGYDLSVEDMTIFSEGITGSQDRNVVFDVTIRNRGDQAFPGKNGVLAIFGVQSNGNTGSKALLGNVPPLAPGKTQTVRIVTPIQGNLLPVLQGLGFRAIIQDKDLNPSNNATEVLNTHL